MFEDERGGFDLPVDYAPLGVDDEALMSDEDYWAMVDELIASDPDSQPAPTAAEVIALGETAPVDPALIGQLDAIDPDGLTEDQRIGLAVAWQRVANYAEAHRGLAVAAAVTASPAHPQVPRELHAAAQLGPALGLGSGATDTLVAVSLQLTDALPATLAAGLAGDLPWRKASSIATATIGLPADTARRVEDTVLPHAWDRSPSRHDAAVRRAVDQADPDHADRTRADRERDIRLVRHHYGAGMGELFAVMRSEDLELTWTAADAYARRCKAAGDPHPLDQLRVAFLAQAARSYLTHGDPTHCATICTPLPPMPNTDPDDTGAWREPPTDRYDDDPPDHEWPDGDDGPDSNGPEDDDPDAGTRGSGDGPVAGPGGSGAGEPAAEPALPPSASSGPPTRQGRPVVLHVSWDPSRSRHRRVASTERLHHDARADGGKTVRANLGPLVRRWHRLKTFTDWTVRQAKRGWQWTSPTGRHYTIEPHDYRLGP